MAAHERGRRLVQGEKGCGADPVSVMELRYRTRDAAGKENDVYLEAKIGQHPVWDFKDCDDPNKDCVLPARYFDPVVYPDGEKECPKPDQDMVWVMELN